jgi:uncharacterized protein
VIVCVAGEELVCSELRALYWPRLSTLFVADVHLGKAASLRSAALPVPFGTSEATLERLSEAVRRFSPAQLVILGDLWHAASGRVNEEEQLFDGWLKRHVALEVILVEGNHDRKSGPLPSRFGIDEVEMLAVGPFHLCHEPCEGDGYTLCGHIHPGVSVGATGTRTLRLPCFWFGDRCGVLPAFGEFTGFGSISPGGGDQIIAIGDGRLHRIAPALAASR